MLKYSGIFISLVGSLRGAIKLQLLAMEMYGSPSTRIEREIPFRKGGNDRGHVYIDGTEYIIVDTWSDGDSIHLMSHADTSFSYMSREDFLKNEEMMKL